jgi:predicted RNase H-like HicB family nuclease
MVVMERDSECYIASVPRMPAYHSQARSLDDATERIRGASRCALRWEGAPEQELEFIFIRRVTIKS